MTKNSHDIMSLKFVLASNNPHKVTEFRRMTKDLNINIVTKEDIGLKDFFVEENANTFEGNAKLKATKMCNLSKLPSISDDSGLIIDALNGEPGVCSARYAGENATDKDRYELVLKKMQSIPDKDRTARFACSICCAFPDDNIISVTGYCEGKIALAPRGNNGFGYDPIFLPQRFLYKKSFAELTDSEKDSISHRCEAMKLLKEELSKLLRR